MNLTNATYMHRIYIRRDMQTNSSAEAVPTAQTMKLCYVLAIASVCKGREGTHERERERLIGPEGIEEDGTIQNTVESIVQ